MKSKLSLLTAAALSSSVSVVVLAESEPASTYDHEAVASYGLTLEEFNSVRSTESPADFGGTGIQGDQDQLWTDAAVFEYEVATTHPDDHAITSPGYHPYLICSTHPDMTGEERQTIVNEIFANTPNVSASHYYTSGNIFHNTDDMSCGAMRAYDDSIHKVYAANPDHAEHMKVNPMHPSMKMVENTVDVLDSWFKGTDAGDIISVDAASNSNRMTVKILGLKMILCPGVQNFEVDDVDDEQIANEIKGFITEDGGRTVADLSFYHHRVTGGDGDTALATERMRQWSNAVTQVLDWTKEDGSNACLDSVIDENMIFTVKDQTLDVKGKLSFWEAEKLAEQLGINDEGLETCVWYMTYALGVSPQVCSIQPQSGTQTLCSDGTSDLSKCPPSSGSWRKSGFSGTMLTLLVLSMAAAVF